MVPTYNELSFGIRCASVISQQVIDNMLSNTPFAMAHVSDITIASGSEKQHYYHFREVSVLIREYGYHTKVE